MKNQVTQLIVCVVLLSLYFSVSAQDTLVLSVVENTPPGSTVGEVLRYAYQQLGIQVTLQELPGLRGLESSNNGDTDGEAFRVPGLEKEYPNLIRVDVPVQADDMYLYVKQGKEFVVEGWESIPKDFLLGYKRGLKFAEYAITEYELRAETVTSTEQLFLKLEADRNDVIVTGGHLGSQLISRPKFNNIIRLEPPIHTSYLYHYLHKKHVKILPKITTVLKKMEANGEIQKIREQVEADRSQT